MKKLALLVCSVVLLGVAPAAAMPEEPRPAALAASVDLPVSVRLGDNFGRKLRGTPRSFRTAVRVELTTMWKYSDYLEECRRAPVVTVNAFDPSGFAATDLGSYGGEPCVGGGAFQLFVKKGRKWRTPTALGGQEALQCGDLLRYRVPRLHEVVSSCYDSYGNLVPYDPAADRAISWNADSVQQGEEFCGAHTAYGDLQHVYATAGRCGDVTVLTAWWKDRSVAAGWRCEGFQNGLMGCSEGAESTVGRSVSQPYLRAVAPGGLLEPTTRAVAG